VPPEADLVNADHVFPRKVPVVARARLQNFRRRLARHEALAKDDLSFVRLACTMILQRRFGGGLKCALFS